MVKKRITHDFETRSECELKTAGAYVYSLHPTTRPTCFAFKAHGNPKVYLLDFEMVGRPWHELPYKLRDLWAGWILDGFEFSAHNSFFEKCIYDNIMVARYGWPAIPPRARRCTAAKAAACALPRNLEGAGEAMRLRVQKDKMGYAAVMATCKPTREWNDWKARKGRFKNGGDEPPKFRTPESDPDIFATLYRYCKIDVLAEEQLDDALPDLLVQEQEIWHLNQKLNWRGLRVDVPTVEKIVGIMETEGAKKTRELDHLTIGLVTKPGSRKQIFDFLESEGVTLPDLKAKTVDDFLSGGKLTPEGRKLLELRKALSKTSTRKYQTFLKRAGPDGRVRDILMYHGASTGRDTGTGIQPHNFPRGVIPIDKDRPYAAVNNIIECDVETLKLLYGENLAPLFSSVLRNMIIPSKGHELFVADFSKIEVAVLWWLAGNAPGLKILEKGLDPYKYMAAANTGKRYEDISDEGDERQLGKAQVLGCGFGMGWKKFQTTAHDQYRLKLTDEQSRAAVNAYREANAAVPELWRAYEEAAIAAVENPYSKEGQIFRAGKCEFFFAKGFLWAKLPSGRRLAYRSPSITWRMREFEVEEIGPDGEVYTKTVTKGPFKTLEFMAVNSKTKKWGPERTWGGTLTENIVQATARDLIMPAMIRLEKKGYRALLMVHDEGICEAPRGKGTVEEFVKILCEKPLWAWGLPLEAKGWRGPRYRK
jgi:DNA polymerase